MRQVFMFFLLLLSINAFSAKKYIANQSDFSSLTITANDSIYFAAGQTFYGSKTISSAHVYLGKYGAGANPIITGFTTVTDWVNLGNNIWESTSAVSTLSNCNMVVIDGKNTAMGRWPNADASNGGYNVFEACSGSTSITDNELSGTPNWVGAEIVVRGSNFKLERAIITSHSGGTIIFDTPTSYALSNAGWGYFIQNDPKTLDQQDEWYYNPTTHKLRVYSTSKPTDVKIASSDYAFTINASYLTIDGVDFEGQNNTSVYSASTTVRQFITIQNCNFRNLGVAAIYGIRCGNYLIQNNTVTDSNNYGLGSGGTYTNAVKRVVRNNKLKNIGILKGMTQRNFWAAMSISSSAVCENNIIENAGYHGLSFYGDTITIQKNDISGYCSVLKDGAGIYTFTGTSLTHMNECKVLYNICHDGAITAGYGTPTGVKTVIAGVYMDNCSRNIEIAYNVCFNNSHDGYGFFTDNSQYLNIHHNTFYNNSLYQARFSEFSGGDLIRNIQFLNNVCVAKSGQYTLCVTTLLTGSSTLDQFGVFDYNIYARPADDASSLFTGQGTWTARSLNYWQTTFNQDLHSTGSPRTVTDADIVFNYASKTEKTITPSQPLLTFTGSKVYDPTTILAYSSFIAIPQVAYYVSNTGNDSNDGLTPSTAWQTLSKVNSTSLSSGANVLFKRGDTFYGGLTIGQSGASGNPIYFGAYGTGANPVISGFTSVSDWTNLGGNIWESTNAISSISTCNMVTINGVNTAMGREPDSGYYTFQSHTGNTQITSSNLSGTPNWTGAEIALNTVAYEVKRCLITSQSGGTLTFAQPESFTIYYNLNFIIQNDPRTLDKQNEWYFDPSTKKLRIYSTSQPQNVKASTIETLVSNTSGDNIVFYGIDFSGSNSKTFLLGAVDNCIIRNCNIDFSGRDAIYGGYSGACSGLQIRNCVIRNSNNNAIGLTPYFSNVAISGNVVENTNVIYGSGSPFTTATNGARVGTAIGTWGDGCLIENNIVKNTGYVGINFRGNNTVVQKNFIQDFCQLQHDGGGIYTWNGSNTTYSGTKVQYNIIENNSTKVDVSKVTDPGIYLDLNSNGIEISNNSITYAGVGIFLGGNHDINVVGNTVFDTGIALRLYSNSATEYGLNTVIKNNVFVAKEADQICMHSDPSEDFIQRTIFSDNIYSRPIANTTIIEGYERTPSFSYKQLSLSGWKNYSGQDSDSKTTITVDNVSKIIFNYNFGETTKAWKFSGKYADTWGNARQGFARVLPYKSLVLIKSTDQTIDVSRKNYIVDASGKAIIDDKGLRIFVP